jgi:hypothetical protein
MVDSLIFEKIYILNQQGTPETKSLNLLFLDANKINQILIDRLSLFWLS